MNATPRWWVEWTGPNSMIRTGWLQAAASVGDAVDIAIEYMDSEHDTRKPRVYFSAIQRGPVTR